MPDPNSLAWKLEEAGRLFLGDNATHGANVTVPARHFDEDKGKVSADPEVQTDNQLRLPSITLEAARYEELTQDTGVYRCQLDARLEFSADKPVAEWEAFVKSVEDAFSWNDLPAELSAWVLNFGCLGIIQRAPGRREVVEGRRCYTYSLLVQAQSQD